jgi:hypothetical protein
VKSKKAGDKAIGYWPKAISKSELTAQSILNFKMKTCILIFYIQQQF